MFAQILCSMASVATIAGLFFVGVQIQQGNESIRGADLSATYPAWPQTALSFEEDGAYFRVASYTFVLTNTGRMPITVLDFIEPDHADTKVSSLWVRLPDVHSAETLTHKDEPFVLPLGEGVLVRTCSSSGMLPRVVLSDGRIVDVDAPKESASKIPQTISDAIDRMASCSIIRGGS